MISRSTQRSIYMGIALVLIAALFQYLHPKFLSPENLTNLSIELAITATLALGMFLVLLLGMIDLSVGSGVGMLGGIAAVLIMKPWFIFGGTTGSMASWPAWLAMLVTLVFALIIWSFMGWIIAVQKVPAFMMTLAGLLIFNGAHWLVIHNSTVPVVPGGTENLMSILTTYYFPAWGSFILLAIIALGIIVSSIKNRARRKKYGLKIEDGFTSFLKVLITLQCLFFVVEILNMFKGVPLSFVILGIVALLIYIMTTKTPMGRYLYAIGGNEDATRLSGISVEKIVILAYICVGAITTLTGFMQTAYGGYSTTTVGKLMELDAVAACVIGGTSLQGGRGTVTGVLFGATIMATLLNGMTLLAVSPELKLITRGSVLVFAVWADIYLARKQGKAV